MAVPVIESVAIENGGTTSFTSLTATKPTGVAVDDLILIIAVNDESGGTMPNPLYTGDPTGFTKELEGGNSTADSTIGIWYRIADGTEGSSWTITSASSHNYLTVTYRISGVDTTTPINVSGTVTNYGSGTSHDAPSITTTVDDCLAISVVSWDGGHGGTKTIGGTGWTDEDSGNNDVDNQGVSAFNTGTKSVTTAGATGICEWTSGSNLSSCSVQIAIAPGSSTQNLTPGLYTDTDTFFAPTITTGAVNLDPSLYDDSADTFPAHTLTTTVNLDAGLFDDSADTFPAHTVAPGAVNLDPGLFDDTPDTFPAATITTGAVNLDPPLYDDSADTFYTADLAQTTILDASLYTDPDTFPAPTVTTGAVNLDPGLYTDPDTFPAATITTTVNLDPSLYTDPDTFPAHTINLSVNLDPPLYVDADTFPAATITTTVNLDPSLYVDADTFPAPTVTTGAVDLTPGLYTDADTFYSHDIANSGNLIAGLYVDPDSFGIPALARWTTDVIYPKAKEQILSGGINLLSDDIRMVMVDLNDYTYAATHEFLSDIPAGARVATSSPLTGKTVTNGTFTSNTGQFTTVSGDDCELLVLYRHTGVDSTARLVAHLNTQGYLIDPDGGTVNVVWSSGQVLSL